MSAYGEAYDLEKSYSHDDDSSVLQMCDTVSTLGTTAHMEISYSLL